jgi:hypothetical protein
MALPTDARKQRALRRDVKVPCAVCGVEEPLTTAQDHHRKPQAFGGDDEQANRVWLCASCHARLHRLQEFLVRGQTASAYELCNSIFPQNAKARGQLWTLANEAAEAEQEVQGAFELHKTHQTVSIKLDTDVWALVKAAAKDHKMSASQYAAEVLRKAVKG